MLQLEDSDCDICDQEELESEFDKQCKLLLEHKLLCDDNYILHLDGTEESSCNVAVGISNDVCEVYNFSNNQVAKIDTLGKQSEGLVGVRFSPHSSNLLYTAYSAGYINYCDLRTSQKLVAQFKDTTITKSDDVKPLQSFDVTSNNRLLAAGTELTEGEAFILFWDVRNAKLLGGYWESHTDDITQVQFHHDSSDLLVTGSTDGLINIYDVSKSNEDEALLNSLNTESSVEQILWCKYNKKDCISCITHTADLQLWKKDGVEPFIHFRREVLGKAIKRKSSAHCYIISTHQFNCDKLIVLASSNWNEGECLRGLQVNSATLDPLFLFKENQQRVRCSWYNQHNKLMVTGGENGIIDFWNVDINN